MNSNLKNIRTCHPIDIENPLAVSMLEMMSQRADEAKKHGTIITSVDFQPLSGEQFERTREAFEDYFSEDYVDDDKD